MNRRAVTLVEVLVVMAITLVLLAILTPVFQSARKQAYKTSCLSNMRQLWLAVSLYREQWSGVDSPAPSYQMGLPLTPDRAFGNGAIFTHLNNPLPCRGQHPQRPEDGLHGYYHLYPPPFGDLADERLQPSWVAFVERLGDATPLVYDSNHQPRKYSSRMDIWYVEAISLSGSYMKRKRRGEPDLLSWS